MFIDATLGWKGENCPFLVVTSDLAEFPRNCGWRPRPEKPAFWNTAQTRATLQLMLKRRKDPLAAPRPL